ncbi:protease inhibitor I42 family protein [Desulfovibrio sp. OttesenSCG-928-F07]|nr:protease inhibitor I42 family protein [Desulfovibrio sp. OttesenSCG-928-F07]
MKKYIMLFCLVLGLVGCAGPATETTEKVYQIKHMYNADTGYFWYLQNEKELKMVQLVSETKTKGAFEASKLGNPHTQTFTFRLKNTTIKSEEVRFEYKHYLEKDEPHAEAHKTILLKASDFK